MNAHDREDRGPGETKMKIFTIDETNNITAFANAEAAAAASLSFGRMAPVC